MFTAADLLDALRQRRIRKSLRPEVPGQLPPGWQAWLEAMPKRAGGVTGAPPADFIAVLAERALATPPRQVGALGRWQAFATLWRQQWQAPVREERGQRWFAIGFSTTLHALFVVMLLWLGYVQIMALPPPAAGENVVQVEFIGEGTPEDAAGGAPGAAQEQEPVAATPAPAAPPQAASAQPRLATAAPPATTPEVAAPQPPAPVAAQPLQVTEVPVPDTAFTLPPPKPRTPDLQQPTIAVPQLRTTPEEIVVEVPRAAAVERRPELPQRDIVVPEVRERVAEIEVPERLPQARALPQRVATPQLQVPTRSTEPGELRIPTRSTAAATSSTPSQQPAAKPTAPASAAPGAVSPSTGTQPRATAAGSGAATTAKPGAQPSTAKSDDWGASSRTRPGGTPAGRAGDSPGLFGADGRPRLADAPSAPARNAPGTVEQNIADLDRAGTWLKRPPYDYQPTMFDRFWVPRETLLQEWVRKGIRSVSIPIPGSKWRINCTVSILQAGGGCGLDNPDVNDQPAVARPPPDVPFKPHLQEDNGSVKP